MTKLLATPGPNASLGAASVAVTVVLIGFISRPEKSQATLKNTKDEATERKKS
jgi:hypothetical protein